MSQRSRTLVVAVLSVALTALSSCSALTDMASVIASLKKLQFKVDGVRDFKLLGIDLQAEAAKLEAQYGIVRTKVGVVSAWQPFEYRAYRVDPAARVVAQVPREIALALGPAPREDGAHAAAGDVEDLHGDLCARRRRHQEPR